MILCIAIHHIIPHSSCPLSYRVPLFLIFPEFRQKINVGSGSLIFNSFLLSFMKHEIYIRNSLSLCTCITFLSTFSRVSVLSVVLYFESDIPSSESESESPFANFKPFPTCPAIQGTSYRYRRRWKAGEMVFAL